MPEAPELANSRDYLRKILVGKRFRSFDVVGGRFKKKPPENFEKFLDELRQAPLVISSVDTKGKFMWWTIGQWFMWCTYGMSGQWTQKKSDHIGVTAWVDDPDGKNLSCVHFRDPRRFGTIKFVHDKKAHEKKLLSLGPDMLGNPPSSGIFAKCLMKKPNRTIVEALMDQSCVSGIGNYIKAEAIYRAGIAPNRHVDSLSVDDIEKIRLAAIAVCDESYRSRGASIRTYRDPNGDTGEMQFFMRAYGQKTCPLGHDIIRQDTPDGRTTHWCPQCQF